MLSVIYKKISDVFVVVQCLQDGTTNKHSKEVSLSELWNAALVLLSTRQRSNERLETNFVASLLCRVSVEANFEMCCWDFPQVTNQLINTCPPPSYNPRFPCPSSQSALLYINVHQFPRSLLQWTLVLTDYWHSWPFWADVPLNTTQTNKPVVFVVSQNIAHPS